MKNFQYTITDASGIHARPAGLLVKECGKFTSSVVVKKGEKTADAKKIFALMALSVKQGETVEVTVEGADEENAALAIETFFKENL